MLKKDKEGFYFETEKGRYSLLEGTTIGGDKQYTSDILFIMDDTDEDGPSKLVTFWAGASELEDDRFRDEYVKDLAKLISEYEAKEK